MADPQTNDIIGVDIIGDFNVGTQLVQSYQFRIVEGGGMLQADLLDDMVDIAEVLVTIVKVLFSTVTVFRKIRARNITQNLVYGDVSFPDPIIGTSADPVSSSTVTAPVSFLTGVPHVVLRKSIGPIAENQITGNSLVSAAALVVLATFASTMLTLFDETNGTYLYG